MENFVSTGLRHGRHPIIDDLPASIEKRVKITKSKRNSIRRILIEIYDEPQYQNLTEMAFDGSPVCGICNQDRDLCCCNPY
jgi:hypothetical protein